jgi:hypothetical protein
MICLCANPRRIDKLMAVKSSASSAPGHDGAVGAR